MKKRPRKLTLNHETVRQLATIDRPGSPFGGRRRRLDRGAGLPEVARSAVTYSAPAPSP